MWYFFIAVIPHILWYAWLVATEGLPKIQMVVLRMHKFWKYVWGTGWSNPPVWNGIDLDPSLVTAKVGLPFYNHPTPFPIILSNKMHL